MLLKRFVTYLYEYNNGRKEKNTGFIRVDIREDKVNMEVCVRNSIRSTEEGKVYVLVNQDGVVGIEIGTINIRGGQCRQRMSVEKNQILGSNYTWNDVTGIVIDFDKDGYLASCWNDECAEIIGHGTFSVFEKEDLSLQSNQLQECEQEKMSRTFVYKKIDVMQIRELPSSNWHLGNNSFLKHGVFNYGFLFLKKEIQEDGALLWLGVPGFFEKPEMLMALLFGFTEFDPIPKTVVDLEMNKESELYAKENQEPKTGTFGAWFVLLDK